ARPPADETLPALPEATPAAPSAAPAAPAGVGPAGAAAVQVRTDVLDLTINLRGGELQRAELPEYPVDKKRPDVPVRLFNDVVPDIFLARSGLRAAGGRAEPTHLEMYTAESDTFELASDADTLVVPLTWRSEDGIVVTKTYTFERGSYAIDIAYDVANESPEDWQAASYVQIVRHYVHVDRSMFDVETYAYRGPAIYDGSGYRKLDVEDEDEQAWSASFEGGWMAALQHHFVAAAIPPQDQVYDYALEVRNNDYVLSYRGPLETIAAGGTGRFEETLFVGPKLQEQLAVVGPRLELTADYGKLTIISQPLFWLLDKVHDFVGNWGWSIVIVTFLIKLLFYKLTETSGRSMAKMRNITPRIKNLQERYKDDREALGRAMMELYKREKINPLAGCLPILIQIPVFLAFYWVLLESVEMRQAPFLGWINDLSSRDPFFILPILMGVAMYGQFKLNPAPPDPMQAKVFAFMPVVMTVMMAWFPAGLVLYWLTNTLLSIAQQWKINKVVEAEAKKH
ncbi:MAG TPA: membrane protein insertase YidC, partial [Steroidobacteraceae bacterium]|nr:membrane protein insertase YidC [Steroidobacteraceae bacterium]